MSAEQELVERLLAPAYWMSGSPEGHEGENDAPREAAATIERLVAERDEADEAIERAEANQAIWCEIAEEQTALARAAEARVKEVEGFGTPLVSHLLSVADFIEGKCSLTGSREDVARVAKHFRDFAALLAPAHPIPAPSEEAAHDGE